MSRKKQGISLPSSGAGITRYFEDYRSKVKFQPGHIIVIAVIVIMLVILMHLFGDQILNLV